MGECHKNKVPQNQLQIANARTLYAQWHDTVAIYLQPYSDTPVKVLNYIVYYCHKHLHNSL